MDSLERLQKTLMENTALKLLCRQSEISYKCQTESETETYTCSSCEDRFYFKSSYDYHIKRFSFKINYFCEQCNVSMTFTNKCSLHLHVNSHGKKYMDLSKVTVKAPEMADLLVNYANFFNGSSNSTIHKMIDKCKKTHSNVDLNNAYLSKNNSKTDITSSVDTLVNAENNILIEKDGISGSQDFTCCPICHTLFKKSGESLIRELITNHFQYLDDSEDFYNLCKKCNRFLPNKCAMSAHEEFHNKSSPYVCPECGMTFSSFLLLEKHMKLTCFHSDRLMVIKCVAEGCNFMCFEPKINEHFTQSHTKLIIQCAECVEKFENKEQLIAHSKCVHNEELASGQNVYECQVCMQVIAKDDAYHALSHFCDAIKANYLYVCNGCRFYFSRICTFKQHLVKCVPYQRKVNPKMNDSVRLKGNVNINKLVRVKYRKINRKSINKKSEKSMTVTPQGINLKKVNSKTVKSMKDNSITDDSMTDDTMMDNPEIIEKVIQNGLPSTYNAVENKILKRLNSEKEHSANTQDEVINETETQKVETDFTEEM